MYIENLTYKQPISSKNQFLRRATKERSREVPIITPEAGTENAAPASGDGAGATCAETAAAAESDTITTTDAFFTMLSCAIFFKIESKNWQKAE